MGSEGTEGEEGRGLGKREGERGWGKEGIGRDILVPRPYSFPEKSWALGNPKNRKLESGYKVITAHAQIVSLRLLGY
jgi:hypothetical protein